MISVCIYSVKKELLKPLCQNIEQTIGITHEIIVVEDLADIKGICKAYNIAASKAKFNTFCFVDENVLFETQGWGRNVISHLDDKTVGLIGISGGNPKSVLPEGWNDKTFLWSANYIQTSVQDGFEHSFAIRLAPFDGLIKQVVCIAGALMCTRRDVYEKYNFDEAMYKPIIYNFDYSIQVFREYKVCVVFDILVRYHIEGTLDKNWIDSALMLSDKWKYILPLSVKKMSFQQFREHHWNCLINFIDKLIELRLPLHYIFRIYFRLSLNRFFWYRYFFRIFKHIVTEHKKVATA